MTDYFGACDASGNPSGSSVNNDISIVFWRAYTCPGSGNKTVTEFMSDVHQLDGAWSCDLRLAIYTADRTQRLAQTARFTPTGSEADSWQGDAVCSGYPALQGGTDYVLAWAVGPSTGGSSSVASYHTDDTRSYGNYKFYPTYCVDGFPADMSGVVPDGSHPMYPMRVGVEDAGGDPAARSLITVATPRWRS